MVSCEWLCAINYWIAIDLAAYSIITENNAGQYYPDYAFNHPLFTDGMRIYSDSKVSDFINGITRDQSLAFLDRWNVGRRIEGDANNRLFF